MPVETARKTHMIRVTNPDDATQYVDVKVIDEISFVDEHDYAQETRFAFDNSQNNNRRKVRIQTVTGRADGTAHLVVERVLEFDMRDPHDYAQDTFYDLDGNLQEPLVHFKTHEFKINQPGSEQTFIKVQRIDELKMRDLHDHAQDTIYALNWLDDDVTDPSELDTSSDGTTINPPWRLDPFQNIVDVAWNSLPDYLVVGSSHLDLATNKQVGTLEVVTDSSGNRKVALSSQLNAWPGYTTLGGITGFGDFIYAGPFVAVFLGVGDRYVSTNVNNGEIDYYGNIVLRSEVTWVAWGFPDQDDIVEGPTPPDVLYNGVKRSIVTAFDPIPSPSGGIPGTVITEDSSGNKIYATQDPSAVSRHDRDVLTAYDKDSGKVLWKWQANEGFDTVTVDDHGRIRACVMLSHLVGQSDRWYPAVHVIDPDSGATTATLTGPDGMYGVTANDGSMYLYDQIGGTLEKFSIDVQSVWSNPGVKISIANILTEAFHPTGGSEQPAALGEFIILIDNIGTWGEFSENTDDNSVTFRVYRQSDGMQVQTIPWFGPYWLQLAGARGVMQTPTFMQRPLRYPPMSTELPIVIP